MPGRLRCIKIARWFVVLLGRSRIEKATTRDVVARSGSTMENRARGGTGWHG